MTVEVAVDPILDLELRLEDQIVSLILRLVSSLLLDLDHLLDLLLLSRLPGALLGGRRGLALVVLLGLALRGGLGLRGGRGRGSSAAVVGHQSLELLDNGTGGDSCRLRAGIATMIGELVLVNLFESRIKN